MLIGSILGVRS